MSNNGNKADKEKIERTRRRFWAFAQAIVGTWAKRKFNYTMEDFEPADIDGPLLVAVNHSCFYDPILVGIAFKNKPLTFIASEHILRKKPWGPMLDKYVSIIPHQKGGKGSRTALVAMKRIKKGESIFLAVEGEQTWNGRPLPVKPFTGKLVKSSGATLVNYVLEGAYLSMPRWALYTRKGKIYGRPAGIYSPGVLKGMSDEEVEAQIAKDLGTDAWEWQKAQKDGPVRYKCSKSGNADGLERSVFTCPSCGAFGTLRVNGDSIGCSCGFKTRLGDTGFFEDGPFETVADWEDLDREKLAAKMDAMRGAAGEDTVFTDDGVVLHRIEDGHNDEEAARGTLTLSCVDGEFRLSIGDFVFDLSKISNMTMVLAGRIVFSDKSGYYELKSNKKNRTNLRKYVIARELIKE